MAKKKEMNRTSGVAGRKLGRSEGIATKLKYGAPLTGSASGVKSISLKDAGEVLTQGIFSASRKGLKMDPAGLAMALPVGKLVKAAGALRAAGKASKAAGLESRVLAKLAGKDLGSDAAKNFGTNTLPPVGKTLRKTSESVFPRSSATKVRTAPNRILEMQGRKRAAEYTDMDRVNDFMSGYPTSKAGAKAFGRAKAPKAISETSAARNKRLNKTYDLPGFDFNPIFKKTRGK